MNGKKQCKRCKKQRTKLFKGICGHCRFGHKKKFKETNSVQGFPVSR